MKPIWTSLLVTIIAVGSAAPVYPQGAGVPPEPNVVDVAGDANYLADQDTALPAQLTPEADLLDGWFTATRTHVIAHIHVAADPREAAMSMNYQIWANGSSTGWFRGPGVNCMVWASRFPGLTSTTTIGAVAADWCWNAAEVTIPMTVRKLKDGTCIMSMSAPRSMTPALRSGRILKNPFMVSRQRFQTPQGIYWQVVDMTETGRDYLIP